MLYMAHNNSNKAKIKTKRIEERSEIACLKGKNI